MSTVHDWVEWAKANKATVEIKISTRGGELDRASIWIWSRRHAAGLSVPVDTEPADLPELFRQKGREKIGGAARAAEQKQRQGRKLLEWADEQKCGEEAPAR